ncbi:hypothetical protein [Clostridium paraputrificum]|uniref:hypothetical protein n=1 Tax=Clostridium paraputrificum TaxID=29363 RepID=UPI0006C6D686|nr:hypothetical protein [Clostridium paraputrificum]CUO65904.1 Uncharacterised protein [Clostridium paraputrificum]
MKIISAFVGIIIFSVAMFMCFLSTGIEYERKFKYIKWIIYCILEMVITIVSISINL